MFLNILQIIRSQCLSLGLFVSLSGFYSSYGMAIKLYPGGTWNDPSAIGYSFWNNYLCDALQQPALNGFHNPGSNFGLAAYGFLLLTLVFWWTILAKITDSHSRRRAKIIRACAAMSCLGLVGTIVFPAEARLLGAHFTAVVFAVFAGLAATLLPFFGFLTEKSNKVFGKIGLLLCSPVFLSILAYAAYHIKIPFFHNDTLIVSMQKISVLAVSMLSILTLVKELQLNDSKFRLGQIALLLQRSL
ncbi:MAG: hypothetical protein HRU09_06260 [Oligoflexales bacterium]|nr:hypothetical protein [Oligoflexales bacterium]